MLSYLYRLLVSYQQDNGIHPNLVYMNHQHFERLRNELEAIEGLEALTQFLGMELVIDNDLIHPHVGHTRLISGLARAI